ncbi:MAG: glycosyltransferase family 4 protein [Nanoarchaeota archaeon]
MKIAIISTFLGQKTSGAEISAFLLAKNLNDHHDVIVITTKITKDMPVKTYPIKFTRFIPNLVLLIGNKMIDNYMSKEIYNILKKEKPDIIHIQDSSMMIAAITAAKKMDIPTVFTVRDYRFVCNLSMCLERNEIRFKCDKKQYKKCLYDSFRNAYDLGSISFLAFPWFYRQMTRLIDYFKKIDYYITVSDFIKKQIILSGISKNKIKTIKVQKEDWNPSEKQSNNIQIFTAGGLKATKGFDFLIKAWKIVADKYPGAKLKIAGDGSAKNKLIELTKQLRLEDNIMFLGQIDHEKMQREYADSMFVISPSLWPEPLTRIIFEAFSMKRCVIATDVGGSSELVKNNKTGLLVKPKNVENMAESIIRLIKDIRFRKLLALNAYNTINKKCNKEVNYKQHIRTYEQVIK